MAALEALAGGITITDACTPDASLTVSHSDAIAGTCPTVITRTYTVTDACLNSVNIIHTINVDDTQAPVVTGSLSVTNVEGCNAGAAPAAATTVAALEALAGGITITDACIPDASLTVTHTNTSAGTCPIVITRTYTVTDACLNSVNIIHTINVDDTQAPLVTGSLNPTTVEGCDISAAPAAVTTVAALEALAGSITITDACTPDASLTVSHTDAAAGLCPTVITRTYTIIDACTNSVNIIHTINVDDTQAPVWTTAVDFLNRTVQCSDAAGIAAAQALFPAATDNCDTDVTNIVKTAGAFVAGTCPEAGTYTNTWTVTDACGNVSAAYTQVITIIDTQAPVWTTAVNFLNRTVQCSDAAGIAAAQALFPAATDNCDTDVTNIVKTAGAFVAGTCPEAGTYTNTWTVTDACGNVSAAYTQVITIIDTQAPVWTTAVNFLNRTVQCSDAAGIAAAQALFPAATDNCDTDVTNIVKTAGAFVAGTCPEAGTYTNTWTVTDACGNVSAAYTQVITIIDTQAPVWTTAVNFLNRTVQCSDAAGIAAAQALFPAATDNCDTDVTNIVKTAGAFVAGTCPEAGSYTNTWTVTDACGNVSAAYTQVITIIDTQAPVWTTAVNFLNRTVQCSDAAGIAAAQALFPAATDNCDTDVTNIVKTAGAFVAGTCPEAGSYTNTWTVTDACGNVSAAYTQVITIIDTQAPVWTTAVNFLNRTVQCSDAAGIAAAQALFPAATDNCDTDVTNIVKTAGAFVAGTCPEAGSYTNTWTVTDACGNVSAAYTQVITIIDTQAPVWTTAVNFLNRTVQCSDAAGIAAAQALFPAATDNCDTDVTNIVKTAGAFVAGTCPEAGSYTNTWTVTDACGNVSAAYTQVITIIDTQAPVWTTAVDFLNRTVQCSDAAGIAAAQALFPAATDNCDTDVTNIVKTAGAFVAGTCPEAGTYTNTWTVTDACGNVSAAYTQVITIIDTQAPVWTTAVNFLNRTVQCSDAAGIAAAQALFPAATDNCDTDVTNIVKTAGAFVAGTCPEAGSYTNTWTVTDACGNVSAAYTQVITIIDTQAPVWTTAVDFLNRTVQCSDAAGIAAAQALFPAATDNCDTDVTNIVKTAGAFVAGTCPEAGSYTNTWTVTDACGNVSAAYTQVITIIDTQAPVWTTAVDFLNRTVQCSDAAGIAAAQALFPAATDNCDTDVTNIVKTAGAFVAGTCPEAGSYTNTWTVTDACGNVSAAYTQVITIIDTQAPVWTTAVNFLNRTVQCSDAAGIAAAQALFPAATDNCDTDVTNIVKTAGAFVAGTCPEAGSYTNTWTVTDACGNVSAAYTQVITIIDTQAPVWTTAVDFLNRTVQCSDAAGIAAAQALFPAATDNCDTDVTNIVKTAGAFVAGTCPEAGSYTNTWTVTDACGNVSAAYTQVITIIDTQAPVWTTAVNFLNRTVQCSDAAGIAAAQALFPAATDNCDTDVTNIVKTAGAFVAGTCPEAGTYTNTWTVTDACGNVSAAYTQVITIIDTQAPVWTTAVNFLNRTVQCSDAAGIAAAQALFPAATDNCDTDVTNIVKTAGAFVAGTCPEAGSYTNTWTVTDACGNVSAAYTQVITIIDTQAPVWTTAVNFLNRTVQCSDAAGIAAAQALFPAATDNCDTDVTNIVKTAGAFVAGTCPEAGSYTNTWTVTDACGNVSAAYTQVITIIDTQAPVWTTAVNFLNRTVQCSDAAGIAAAQALFPAATDNCDTDVTNIVKTAGAFVAGTCPEAGTYTNTWTVTDACGNVSAAYTQVITIIDTQAPVWTTAVNFLNRTVQCSDAAGIAAAQALFPAATDNCDTDVTNIVKTAGAFVAGTCPEAGSYTNTWTVTDACGNVSAAYTQVITIIDTQAPVWTTAVNFLNRTVQCSDAAGIAAAQALFPAATDNCDTDVTNIVKTAGAFVAGTCPEAGSYTNTWTVTDACGNVSAAYTQVITIIDTQAPVWTTAVDFLNRTVQCSDAAGIAAAQALFPAATDNCDTDVTNIVKTAGAFVAGTCPEAGNYTNTWTVTDACGNVSAAYTQVITIIDTQAPVWTTAVDFLNRTVQCSDAAGIAAAQALFPAATDNCDTDVTNIVKTAGAFVAGTCPEAGSYTNTWTVTDACGNVSAAYTQVITIIDTQAPVWTTAVDFLNRTVQCSDAAGIAAAQALFPAATDNCDTDVTNIVKTAGAFVAGTCPEAGSYTNTWTVTDACGNVSAAYTQVITIIDTQAPVWTTAVNFLNRTVQCSDAAGIAAAQALFPAATDNCDTDVTNIVKTAGAFVAGTCPEAGSYTNTWTVTDACGNVSAAYTQVITIIDTQAPVWTTAVDFLNRTVQCSDAAGIAAAQALFPAATDNCDTDVTNIVKTAGAFVAGTCPEAGSYTNTGQSRMPAET